MMFLHFRQYIYIYVQRKRCNNVNRSLIIIITIIVFCAGPVQVYATPHLACQGAKHYCFGQLVSGFFRSKALRKSARYDSARSRVVNTYIEVKAEQLESKKSSPEVTPSIMKVPLLETNKKKHMPIKLSLCVFSFLFQSANRKGRKRPIHRRTSGYELRKKNMKSRPVRENHGRSSDSWQKQTKSSSIQLPLEPGKKLQTYDVWPGLQVACA